MKNHFPCGHWHKRRGGSTTITETVKIAFAPQYYEDDGIPTNGIGVASFNPITEQWTYEGVALNGYPEYSEPATLRVTKDYIAYYGPWSPNDWTKEMMRLYVFKNTVATYTDLWTYSAGVNTFYDYASQTRNIMDCDATGLIACIAYIQLDNGVTKNAWAIRCSSDEGATWSAVHYFDQVEYQGYVCGNVRIDQDSNIWVAFQDCYYGSGTSYFYVYKSTDKGATFSLVHKENMGTDRPAKFVYSIDRSGMYQYFVMVKYYPAPAPWETVLYKSQDYGVSWIETVLDVEDIIRHASNVENLTLANYLVFNNGTFRVSNDYGATFSTVTPPEHITDYYVEMQNDKQYICYVECGEDFDPGVAPLGLLHSEDNGLTWKDAQIPVTEDFNQPVFTAGFQQSVGVVAYTEILISDSAINEEPMVWSMPSGQHY